MTAASETDAIRAVPVRHPGRWAWSVVVLVLLAMLAHTLVTNHRFGWNIVGQYLFTRRVLTGLLLTLELTAIAMLIGIVLGIVLAVMRRSVNPLLSSVSWGYIWFFRGTPVLVQILFWYNLSYLFPRLGIGIPFGPELVSGSVNSMISPVTAVILGLGLNEAAYMAEIVRAGMLSVDEGQTEAAMAMGMTRFATLRRVVLPQAMRVIIPPTGNETIGMLKTTSLASVAAVAELLYSVQLIYAVNYLTVPLLIVASIWYLVVTSVLTVGQTYIERRFSKGARRPVQTTVWHRLWRNLATFHDQGDIRA